MFRFSILAATLAISACSTELQNTSGRDYLAANGIKDEEVAKFAAYEPELRFPARTGVVRFVYGQITNMPEKERVLYSDGMTEGLGELVHLGPLEAKLLDTSRYGRMEQLEIRQLAASRHLDYVLVLSYNLGKNSAEALFLDVRSGYPYASIETSAPGRGKRNFWGGPVRKPGRLNRSTYQLAQHLKPELEVMAEKLVQLAGR